MFASNDGNLEIVREQIKNGADVNIKNLRKRNKKKQH